LRRLQLLDDAMNALIAPDAARKDFLAHERLVSTLYKAVKPDPAALEFSARAYCLTAIADAIRATLSPNPVDISDVMGRVQEVLDNSIAGVDVPGKPAPQINLSAIDFDTLRERFKKSKHRNTDLERLKAAIRAQLEKMIRFNKTRTDYLEKFEELIESYNNGSRSIEEILDVLLNFTDTLSEEQQRHIREHLSEEELTIFDLLTRPGPDLSPEEREEVKKVARQVLDRLKSLLALDWRRHTQARAKVRLAIEDALDGGLPENYTRELFSSKCSAIFEHVYESYYGEGSGIYEKAS
jgi:type I restriction enzyme R subunit